MPHDITLEVAGARVTLPAATLTSLWLERVRGGDARGTVPPPKIGSTFPDQHGIYAGLIAGTDELGGDAHLVVLAGDRGDLTWPEALAWAESVGGRLPTRREQAILFGNVPQLFENAWYWSSEQYAGDDESAWIQAFDLGLQSSTHKASRCRARAVRRVPIR